MAKGKKRKANDDAGRKHLAIGERLELVRNVLNLPQNAFAEGAGLSPNTYNQYESGVARPSVDNAIMIADTYGITLDWIYRNDPTGLPYAMALAIKAIRQARNR